MTIFLKNRVPKEVLLLPEDLQNLYVEILEEVVQRQPLAVAHRVAWDIVKQKLENRELGVEEEVDFVIDEKGMPIIEKKKKSKKKKMPKAIEEPKESKGFTVTTTESNNEVLKSFDLQPVVRGKEEKKRKGLVVQAIGDDLVFEGVLATTQTNREGMRWTPQALEKFATYINDNGLFGDISDEEVHAEMNDLVRQYSHLSDEDFAKAARINRKGIVRAMKASFVDGKLWIKGYIDKRYKRFVDRLENLKMSLEAMVPESQRFEDTYMDGHLLGLTLVDDRAVDPNSFARLVEE